MRFLKAGCALWLLAIMVCTSASGQDPGWPAYFDIRAQPLDAALQKVAETHQLELLFLPADLKGLTTRGVKGTYSPMQAIERLLEGTGLIATFDGKRAIAIKPADKKADQSPGNASAAAATRARAGVESQERILVTAQKRSELLTDVPVPVTSLNAQSLVDRNEVRLQDYYARVPGLNLTLGPGAQDAPVVSIRGITTGGTGFGANPTVGIVVDDVPYGSSSSLGGGNLVPDIDPSDLARIEVLRGPQGTLYGASSIGGLLKFVTIDPSPQRFSGRAQAGLTSVSDGDDLGYSARGAVNVPLANVVAIRASGFVRRDAGFIDDPGQGLKDLNKGDFYGGRIAALWRPSDAFSLKLSAVHQSAETDGSDAAHRLSGLSDLQQSYVLPHLGGYARKSQVYSATASAALGAADLVSITGYSVNKITDSLDRTAAFRTFTRQLYGVDGAQFVENFKTDKFAQEIRLTVPMGQRFEWLLGAFYTSEKSEGIQDVEVIDPTNGRHVALGYHNPFAGHYRERAIFANLTFRSSERFDVQVGGRASRNKQDLAASFEGGLVPILVGVPSGHVYPTETSEDESFTYLVTPRFKLTPQIMTYARFASGYRPGGPNSNASALGVPARFGPDTTRNYELGAKGDLLGGALSFDASIYSIDWDDIQLQFSDPVTRFVYFANGGKARSRGIELALEGRPTRGLSVAGWVAWNEAELTQDFPPGPAVGRAGDRLPFSSRISGHVSADQRFPLMGSASGVIGASVTYIGERLGVFARTAGRQIFPSYTQVDLRAGMAIASWTVDLVLKNATDERGILAGGIGTSQVFAFRYIQPRTIALSVAKTF